MVQQLTARFSFPLFWPAYTAGAITTLFGPTFEPAKRRGREIGLAFASAHLVRLGFVARLSYIGAASALVYFSFSELPHCGLTLLLCSRFLVCKGAGVKGLSKGWWVLASALPRFF